MKIGALPFSDFWVGSGEDDWRKLVAGNLLWLSGVLPNGKRGKEEEVYEHFIGTDQTTITAMVPE
jgi:hypothetical protein